MPRLLFVAERCLEFAGVVPYWRSVKIWDHQSLVDLVPHVPCHEGWRLLREEGKSADALGVLLHIAVAIGVCAGVTLLVKDGLRGIPRDLEVFQEVFLPTVPYSRRRAGKRSPF
jgi:hypothetical protein